MINRESSATLVLETLKNELEYRKFIALQQGDDECNKKKI
jgi:hypothetical protein